MRWDANAGIVGNFTRSLLGASSEFVIQLGDDDIAAPSLVERTVAALDAHPRAGVAHSRFALIDADGGVLMAVAGLARHAVALARAGPGLRRALDGPRLPRVLLDRADPALGRARGRAEKLERFDVLEANLRKLIQVKPDHAHAYNALGYSFAERNTRLAGGAQADREGARALARGLLHHRQPGLGAVPPGRPEGRRSSSCAAPTTGGPTPRSARTWARCCG